MTQRTKKQHWIPNKSYLDYFADDTLTPKSLWVYFNKKEVFEDAKNANSENITPANLCKKTYLYETPRLPINSIEKILKSIEDNYKHVLDTKIIQKKPLNSSDRIKVAQFISTLEMRTPLNKKNTDKFISDIRTQVSHLEHQFDAGRKSKLHEELDEADKQNLMFTQTLMMAAQMNRYQTTDLLFLHPRFDDEETFFITSDFPVNIVDFNNMNSFFPPTPMDSTIEVTIPLTPKIALLANNLGLNGYKEIDYNFVWEINNRTLKRSDQFIISSKKFGERFTSLNVKRHAQSFVVMLMSDIIAQKRMRRMRATNKKTVLKLIKEAAKIKISNKTVSLKAKNKEDFSWFSRILDSISINRQEKNDESILFTLKKKISVKSQEIAFVKLINHKVQK